MSQSFDAKKHQHFGPGTCRFKARRSAQDGLLRKAAPHDLQADRQTIVREAHRGAGRRLTREVEGVGEDQSGPPVSPAARRASTARLLLRALLYQGNDRVHAGLALILRSDWTLSGAEREWATLAGSSRRPTASM